MRYYVAVEAGDKDHAYGVVVPDFPGCHSAGDTLEEALANVEDAILLHMEDCIEDRQPFPEPSSAAEVAKGHKGWVIASVSVNPELLSTRAKRINVTIPEGTLYLIDMAAGKANTTRSAFIADAALSKAREIS